MKQPELFTNSEAPPPVAVSPQATDPKKVLFDYGPAILVESGVKEPTARSIIGRWLKDGIQPAAILKALKEAQDSGAIDRTSYARKLLRSSEDGREAFLNE